MAEVGICPSSAKHLRHGAKVHNVLSAWDNETKSRKGKSFRLRKLEQEIAGGQGGHRDNSMEKKSMKKRSVGKKPESDSKMWKWRFEIWLEKILQASYPPGYEYRGEGAAVVLLLGIGTVLNNFNFFKTLRRAVDYFYIYININGKPVKTFQEGLEPITFVQVTEGYWGNCIPLFLFLAIMAGYHYFYYYRGSKSIYLMRRLPKHRALLMSCVQGPLICAAVAAALALVLYLLYFGIYLLAMPVESMPRFM